MPDQDAMPAVGGGIPTVRGCDGCTLCCKLLRVPWLEKPANVWCKHCDVGVGCGIYATRPTECAGFVCGYLVIPDLSPEWKPAVSHLIIMPELKDGRINVLVDPSRPDAWRRDPYHRTLREWARLALARHAQVVVSVRGRSVVVLPDQDVDVGVVRPDDVITVVETPSVGGKASHEVYVVDGASEAGQRIAAAKGQPVPLTSAAGDGFRRGRTLA